MIVEFGVARTPGGAVGTDGKSDPPASAEDATDVADNNARGAALMSVNTRAGQRLRAATGSDASSIFL
jgi:hypothetical protein